MPAINLTDADIAELRNRPGVASLIVGKSLAEQTSPKAVASAPVDMKPFGATKMVMEVTVPIRLVNESNGGGQLRTRILRKKEAKAALSAALPPFTFPTPALVTITKLGGKQLDEDDNLPRACKVVKDFCAQWLGVEDTGRDKRVRWKFRQAAAYEHGVRIRIETVNGG